MKVAFLTEIPTPYRQPLFERLVQMDGLPFEVIYCVSTVYGRNWEWRSKTYPYSILTGITCTFRGKNNTFVLKINPSIWRRLSTGRYDVIVIGGCVHPTMQLAMLWCRLHGVPYLILSESHHLTPRPLWKRILKQPLIRFAINGAAAFLVMGSNARDYLIYYGADSDKIFFFPNTPDIDRLREEAERYRQQKSRLHTQLHLEGNPVILYVGRLVGVKNVDTLLRAFQQVQREVPQAGLAIVGDGPLRRSLQNSAQELGLSNVCFAGFVQHYNLAKYYAAADVFVLPSYDEPWGVVVLEAMACGLPVAVSDKVGCARDLVHPNENGFIISTESVSEWALALIKLLRDDELCQQMGKLGQELVRRWDYDFCISQLQKVLRTALNNKCKQGSQDMLKKGTGCMI